MKLMRKMLFLVIFEIMIEKIRALFVFALQYLPPPGHTSLSVMASVFAKEEAEMGGKRNENTQRVALHAYRQKLLSKQRFFSNFSFDLYHWAALAVPV